MLKIALDFEGVISDTRALKAEVAKQLFGVDISVNIFAKDYVIRSGLLTRDQYRAVRKVVCETEAAFRMVPVEGALTYIPKLIADGHGVEVITSRGGLELDLAQQWTRNTGLRLDFTGVGYGNSKADAAKGFDVYIDDDFGKMEPLVGIVPHLFLFSWDYNLHITACGVAERVGSWKEFYAAINKRVPK